MDSLSKASFENAQLDIDSLPRHGEVEFSSLNPKYLVKLNIITTAGALIFLGGFIAAFALLENYRGLLPFLAILFLLLFFLSYYRNFQLQKRNGYALRERDIIFQRGFIYKKTTVVPFNRVQHVSIGRDLLDKLFGISTLQVFTAGGSGSDIRIPGLHPKVTNNLKEEISKRISSHE